MAVLVVERGLAGRMIWFHSLLRCGAQLSCKSLLERILALLGKQSFVGQIIEERDSGII